MNLVLIEIVAAAVLVVILVAVVVAVLGRTGRGRRGNGASDPAALARPFAGARAVVDRSLGMYVLRRLTGRPTDRDPMPVEPANDGAGAAARVATGMALASTPPAPAGAAIPRTAIVAAPKASALPATRAHLVRDTGFALLVVAVVVVAAIGLWP